MLIEEKIRDRCAVLGVNDTVVPHVLTELQRIAESKALATASPPTSDKELKVKTLQKQRRFKASQRAHSKAAAKSLDKEIESLNKYLLFQLKQVKSGELSKRRAQSKASIAFKDALAKAYKLGMKSVGMVNPTGRLADLDKNEEKWIASYFREEFGYFKKFLRQVNNQTDKQLIYRVGLYSSAVRSVYESARVLTVGPNVIITWVLQSDDPCPDCRLIARYNPYLVDLLPTTPKAGSTRCRSNCYCVIRIDLASPAEIQRVRKKHIKSSTLLRRIKSNQKKRSK